MSEIKITELGRKWYGVAVFFNDREIEKLDPDILRGLGGKLRYDNTGGLRALFHFNVTNHQSGEQMVKVLTYFGKGGYFENGMTITSRSSETVTESESIINKVINDLQTTCRTWSEQWHEIAADSIQRKITRVEVLRKIKNLGLTHITESKIRIFIENILRRKYQSDIFVETVMWRLGWPDQRKPLIRANPGLPLQSELTSAG